jgi:MHS family citrate/tricarballylate:H+ symporter-like MFS transporter
MLTAAERHAKIKATIRVASGNFIEAYDFFVYGYYAQYIARTFFPSENEYASLMLSLLTFGAGYLIRPLGAIVLGGYMDKHGRRKGLILTLSLMAAGTVSIALTPSYAEIGLLAPLLVVAGRLLQGLSAGAEFGGVAIYLAEIATPGRRGFYCCWQAVSQQVAVIVAASIGLMLTVLIPPEQMGVWGWRVPLLIGTAAVPLILWLRNSLEETEAFRLSRHVRTMGEIMRILAANWLLILTGVGLTVMMTTSFYLITAYTPTYARAALQMAPADVFLITLFVGMSNLAWLPVGGILTDRFGARPLMMIVTAAAIVTAYPAMIFLVAGPSFFKLLGVLLLYSMFFGLYAGGLIPLLTEIMPREVRTTAFSFAFVTATAVFGGFTPAIATYLIEMTGNRAAPSLWLSLAAVISFLAAYAIPRVVKDTGGAGMRAEILAPQQH